MPYFQILVPLLPKCEMHISVGGGGGGGTGGREPGRTGGGRGTGDGRRKGGRRDLYDGGKRERNSKRQAFALCYSLLPVKETNPRTFLDFHLTRFPRLTAKFYTREKSKNENSCSG